MSKGDLAEHSHSRTTKPKTIPKQEPSDSRHMYGSVVPALIYFQVFFFFLKATERGGSRPFRTLQGGHEEPFSGPAVWVQRHGFEPW